jgi:membrane dipeptidase
MLLRFLRNDSIYHNFSFDQSIVGDTDIPRLRKGLVGGQFWSVFVPWYSPPTKSGNEVLVTTLTFNLQYFTLILVLQQVEVRDTLEQIDVTKRLIELYPDDVQNPQNLY